MLQAEGLSCERSRRRLFSGLQVSLAAGELLHVRGANGSGKTTLLRILMGLYTDYEGDIDWQLEKPPLYMGHSPAINARLTVEENVRWLCSLQDVDVADAALDESLSAIGLGGYQDTNCSQLSEGQKKRVNLVRFFLCENPCWIMDEPFSALDVAGFDYLQQAIQRHLDGSGAIVLTSHQETTIASARFLELGS